MRHLLPRLIAGVILLCALGGATLWLAHVRGWLAPGDDPWGRLDLGAPPGLFTARQLHALIEDPVACLAVLKAARVAFTPMPDRPIIEGCGFADALRLQGEKARFREPVVLTCAMAAGLVLFERQILQPAAEKLLGSRVTRIEDYGTYNCRNIGREESRRRSEHAKANAIDLAGFVLADGRHVTLAGDWGRPGAEGRFLIRLRDGACGLFKVVLGPDYNADHRDHFHVDMGPFDACR
ncbi:extensin family protein [Zavarzinia sp.]|uniref:extensin-like domain-containing protein n=1 Tax=Zavarzinia sp. TaxID=2027920 RepID=UPI003BB79C7A